MWCAFYAVCEGVLLIFSFIVCEGVVFWANVNVLAAVGVGADCGCVNVLAVGGLMGNVLVATFIVGELGAEELGVEEFIMGFTANFICWNVASVGCVIDCVLRGAFDTIGCASCRDRKSVV